MTTIRRMEVKDGWIEGLEVAGFHGEIDPGRTPARRGAIHVDADRHVCLVREEDERQAVVEVSAEVVEGRSSLQGSWTPTLSWPARVGALFLILGPNEHFRINKLFSGSHRGESEATSPFLQWMNVGEAYSDMLCAERQRSAEGEGDLWIWYCPPSDADEIVRRLGSVYTGELLEIVAEGDANKIQKAAFRLWRAASSVEDVYLVAAALQRTGYRRNRWEELLREGAREASPKEREEGVLRALSRLSRGRDSEPPAVQIQGSHRKGLRAKYLVPGAGFREGRRAA